ncbi:MAG: isocitrate/isopropylmalate dehydrogenase family protein [Anaerolineaceae bacterium]|nr:isocitrate/isopropylmalate dehydrogenase family protein [Anaerolineaceae bacterium]MDE0327527.1 isocitrate/isopropylmalate dehydrogenase family protein [Anaerolineaceae bacterium]
MTELCVFEGDGVGHEVIPAALQVLRHVAPDIRIRPAAGGWSCFREQGTPLPEESLALARRCRAVLFGAVNSPSWPVENYFSPVVRLRRELQAFANLRPTRYLPVPTARAGVDLVIVRENTEDLYVGNETTKDGGQTGVAQKVITRGASERVARLAFELASRTGRKKVTIVHKSNVLPRSDGLFRQAALEISEYFTSIETDELLVDTAAYWMVKEPMRFDVVLTPNLYGDILSDMAAAWGGGLGMAPSISVGEDVAIAEPVHGTAPDIAGRGIANPTASILSVALLLRHHWQRAEDARRIEQAVHETLRHGEHTGDIHSDNALSTQEFTDQVCAHMD